MRVLSLDGGGYLGLASASYLAEVERHFSRTCSESFELFCGTSTGAILALGLASGLSAADLVEFYENVGPRVFPAQGRLPRALRWIKSLFISKYDNVQLRSALGDVFGNQTLRDLRREGRKVTVTAFNLATGEPRIFKTDHAPGLTRDDEYRLADIALASAATPVYLPVVSLRSPADGLEERFCDGGLFANHPALIGYAEVVNHLDVPPEEVRILSVSTPRSDLAEHESDPAWLKPMRRRGLLSWAAPSVMNIAIDSTSRIAHHALRLITERSGATYRRVRLERPRGVQMDLASPAATATLKKIGRNAANTRDNRDLVASFFS
jgi:patatin-like phospholipase/acyl hydrolase